MQSLNLALYVTKLLFLPQFQLMESLGITNSTFLMRRMETFMRKSHPTLKVNELSDGNVLTLRFVRHKSAALSDLMLSKHIDILALTETWLSAFDTSACLAVICPYGFCLYHHPRRSGRGGGVAFLVPATYKVEIIHTPQYQSFEVICIVIKHSPISANFICIYHPPASTTKFVDEFPDFLTIPRRPLHVWWRYIHLDLPSLNTRSFMDVPQTYALHQHI